MTPPKRIRLLTVLKNHLYSRVKQTLATDKEIRTLRYFDKRIEDWYVKQVGATELCSTCYTGNCICKENAKRKVKEVSNG